MGKVRSKEVVRRCKWMVLGGVCVGEVKQDSDSEEREDVEER